MKRAEYFKLFRVERDRHDKMVAAFMRPHLQVNPYITAAVMARLLTDAGVPTPRRHMDTVFGRNRDGENVWKRMSVVAVAGRTGVDLPAKND